MAVFTLETLKSTTKRRTVPETNQAAALIGGPKIKKRSSVGSDFELKTRWANDLNQVSNNFLPNEAKYTLSYKFWIY